MEVFFFCNGEQCFVIFLQCFILLLSLLLLLDRLKHCMGEICKALKKGWSLFLQCGTRARLVSHFPVKMQYFFTIFFAMFCNVFAVFLMFFPPMFCSYVEVFFNVFAVALKCFCHVEEKVAGQSK